MRPVKPAVIKPRTDYGVERPAVPAATPPPGANGQRIAARQARKAATLQAPQARLPVTGGPKVPTPPAGPSASRGPQVGPDMGVTSDAQKTFLQERAKKNMSVVK